MKVKSFIIGLIIPLLLTAGIILYLQHAPKLAPATEIPHQKDVIANVEQPKVNAVNSNTTAENPDAFYQLIIDTNIFRPLGWQPPRKQPDYTLIGTAVSQNTADSKAFILERRSNRLHTVKVGDTLDDVRVKEIQSKRVTLHEAGKDIVLHGGRLQFF